MYVSVGAITDQISTLKEAFFIALAHYMCAHTLTLITGQTSFVNWFVGNFPPVESVCAICQIVWCTLTPKVLFGLWSVRK